LIPCSNMSSIASASWPWGSAMDPFFTEQGQSKQGGHATRQFNQSVVHWVG
jgi:hypothetical protein